MNDPALAPLTASNALDGDGNLVVQQLSLDLGLSRLKDADDESVILSDGRIVRLSGEQDDLTLVSQDFMLRKKQTLVNAYLSGRNLSVARKVFIDKYDDGERLFFDALTEMTGFSKAKFKAEIRLAENYTQEQVQLLSEAQATQTVALKLLKSSSAKAEALDMAANGSRISEETAKQLTEEFDSGDDEEDFGDEFEAELISTQRPPSQLKNFVHSPVESVETETSTVEVPAVVTRYSDLVQDTGDFTPPEELDALVKLDGLLKTLETSRYKHELTAVRGEAIRSSVAQVFASYYAIPVPSEFEEETEPDWVNRMRNLLPKANKRRLSGTFQMSFIEGYLSWLEGIDNPPGDYQKLADTKRMSQDAVSTLYEFWAIGYAQAKKSFPTESGTKWSCPEGLKKS